MCKEKINKIIKKLRLVLVEKYSEIQEDISIDIKNSANSCVQIVLKRKTVLGSKGQVQITSEIQIENSESAKTKSCSILNYDLRRLTH